MEMTRNGCRSLYSYRLAFCPSLQGGAALLTRYVNVALPNVALFPHHPKYLEPLSSQPNSGLTVQ
eukprot:scaffold81625_cov72-Attheya_sp.AAC.3